MTSQSGGRFNYTCQFAGLAGTLLTVNNTNQLVMPVETLECYSMSECRDYPHTLLTSMRSISVNTATASLPLNFSAVNRVTECGQHTIVVSNAASGGQVDLLHDAIHGTHAGGVYQHKPDPRSAGSVRCRPGRRSLQHLLESGRGLARPLVPAHR